MEYDYDSYIEEQEELMEVAREEIMEQACLKKEDDLILNFGIKKEWVRIMMESILYKYAEECFKNIKKEVVDSIKKELVDNKFDEILEEELRNSIKLKTDNITEEFMNKPIKIHTNKGRWNDEVKEIVTKDYIQNLLDDWIENKAEQDMKKMIDDSFSRITRQKVESFGKELKNSVEDKINAMFNQTVKNQVSDTLFNILTQSDTYKQIRTSMDNLLEDK